LIAMNNDIRFVSQKLAVRLVVASALVITPFTHGVVGAVPRSSALKSDPSAPIFLVGAANTPNDIAGPQALSTAVLKSGGDPRTVNEWLRSQILYGLTPDEAAGWRATLRQFLPLL
jgi:hypothetical protein